jgi:hypothetical protein
MLTRLAYERELAMKIDQARVINVYLQRDGTAAVEVIEPETLVPEDWPSYTNLDVLYESLKAPPAQ